MKLSQFTSGSGVPVGGKIDVPINVNANQLTEGAATYLRAGVLIPYVSPNHDKIASLGFKQNKWITTPNNLSAIIPNSLNSQLASADRYLPNKTGKMFAMGSWGVLVHVARGIWTFTGTGSTVGRNSPVMIVEPPLDLNYTTLFYPRTNPAWCPDLNTWVIVEIKGGGNAITGISTSIITFYTSADGVNWAQGGDTSVPNSFFFSITTSISGSLSIFSLAAIGSSIVLAYSNYCVLSNTGYNSNGLLAFNLTNDLKVLGVNPTIANIANNTNDKYTVEIYQVTAGDIILTLKQFDGTNYKTQSFHISKFSTGKSLFMNSPASPYMGNIAVERNSNRVVIIDMTYAETFFIPIGSNGLLTTSSPTSVGNIFSSLVANNTQNALVTLFWTGAYWVAFANYYDNTTTNNYNSVSYSANGQTWTSVLNGPYTGPLNGSVTKNHLFYLNTLFNMVGNANVSTVSLNNNQTSYYNSASYSPLEFNGLSLILERGTIRTYLDTDGIENLVYNPTTTELLGASASLKIVNNIVFAVNTNSKTLIYSTDGTIWNTVALPATNGAGIVDVEFFAGRYIVTTLGSTNNAAYATTLAGPWTTMTIGSSGGSNGMAILNAGTYLISGGFNDTIKRSTDGITWVTPTSGAPSSIQSNYSVFQSGGISYIYTGSGQPNYTRFSSPDGNVWTSGLLLSPVYSGIPTNFIVFNNKIYCKVGLFVFTTTDFITFLPVTSLLSLNAIGLSSRLYIKNNSLRYKVLYDNNLKLTECIMDSLDTFALIGYDYPTVSKDGTVPYLRIS